MPHRDPALQAHIAQTIRGAEMRRLKVERDANHKSLRDEKVQDEVVENVRRADFTIYPRLTPVYSEDRTVIVGTERVYRYHVFDRDDRELSIIDRPDGFGTYDEALDWATLRVKARVVKWMGFGATPVEAKKIDP